MKVFKTAMKVYIIHILVVIATVFFVVPLYNLLEKSPLLYSMLMSLLYICVMYISMWRVGYKDAREIPGFYPDKMLPVKVSCYASILPVILLLIRIILPDIWYLNLPFLDGSYDFIMPGCKVVGTPDMLYRIWYIFFYKFVPCGNYFAYAAQIFVLPVVLIVSYNLGIKRFSIIMFVTNRLIYSGKDKEN